MKSFAPASAIAPHSKSQTPRIPVTVITGFLGAGKTTLIRHVLENARGKRLALIINEFGELGIDRSVLAGCGDETCREEDMIELANGCICCTVADDFIPTMRALLDRAERPDHIIIETSGLALPQPLVRAFNWPEIKAELTIDSVITLADADALAAGRFAASDEAIALQRQADPMLDHATPLGELFADQLVAADLVVLNKADLVAPARLAEIEAKLRAAMRPGTGLIRSSHGRADLSALLGLGLASETEIEHRPSAHELEHGGEGHEHDDFDSLVVSLPQHGGRDALLDAVRQTIARFGVLRLKGFAAIEGMGARLAIQAVGPRLDAAFDRPWRDGEARQTSLVVIGQSPLDKEGIALSLRQAAA